MVKEKKTLYNKSKNINIENILDNNELKNSKKNKTKNIKLIENESNTLDISDSEGKYESDLDNDDDQDDDQDDDDQDDDDQDDINHNDINDQDEDDEDDEDNQDEENNEDDNEIELDDEEDNEIKSNYIDNEEQLKKKCFSKYLKDEDEDIEEIFVDDNLEITDNSRVSKPILSKYEKVRILSTRTKQLLQGSKPMVKDIEGLSTREIALLELKNKVIPLIIERPIPNSAPERWKLSELEIL